MNKKISLKVFTIISIIFTIIVGTLLHFVYEWSNNNIVAGIFGAINESTWEHLKLLFYPMILMAILGYFIIGKRTENYWFAKAIGILTAMIFTITFFYTYSGVIGTNIHWLNIATFIMAVILGQYITYRLLIFRKQYNAELVSIFFLIILFLSFILYTINPPLIGLFRNPIISS